MKVDWLLLQPAGRRVERGLRVYLVALVGVVMGGCVTAPPVQEMSDARQAIRAAEDADAERLAAGVLDDARRFLAEAERQIQQQSYGPARLNAQRAKNRAASALRAAQSNDARD